MKLEAAYPETEIWFDAPVDEAFTALLDHRNAARIAVFTGGASADRSGIWRHFEALLGGRLFFRFSAIEAEPCVETVRAMVGFLHAKNVDTVIALGGGSVMDAAKAAWLTAQSGGDVADYFGNERRSALPGAEKLDRVICFPTTSGTGSEVTPYANIVVPELGVKKLIVDTALIPSHAFVLPMYAMTMPPELTLATGCDALSHLLEGFLNVGADNRDPGANERAKKGIEILIRQFPAALRDGTALKARAGMALAAVLGGMTIRFKPTGLPHLCSYSWFGRIPHGLATAMLLPAAWRYYLGNPAVAARTMDLASFFSGSSPEEVIASYRAFLTRCGVPEALSAAGVTPDMIESAAASGAANPMKLESAPRPVPLESSREILLQLLKES